MTKPTYNSPQTVSQVIKATRDARPKDQSSLRNFGQALGVSYQQISFYENGQQEPSVDKLRDWLHSPIEWVSDMAKEIMVVKYRYYLNIVSPTYARKSERVFVNPN